MKLTTLTLAVSLIAGAASADPIKLDKTYKQISNECFMAGYSYLLAVEAREDGVAIEDFHASFEAQFGLFPAMAHANSIHLAYDGEPDATPAVLGWAFQSLCFQNRLQSLVEQVEEHNKQEH